MTIEEKAKAYDEALERAKAYHRNELAGSRREMTEYIFPELRESEDERIRKEIIDFLETIPANELKRIPRPISEWFSYLEKQKEQKPEHYSPLCNTVKDKIREYIANHFVADTVVKTDIKSIVKAMEEGVRLGREEYRPAEWSEEDKDNLDNIIWLCENCEKRIENVWIPSQATQIKNLIKSLRPQPSWKPSKEQMMALEDVITMKRAVNEAATEVLREIYEQLKKL